MRHLNAICVLLVSIGTTNAVQCAAPPLNLPLRTLSVAPESLSHGIPVSIGTPPQQVVLTPSLQLDTPFVPRYTNSCIYDTEASIPANDTRWKGQDGRTVCAGMYGGGFTPNFSATFYDNRTNSPVSEAWFKRTRFSQWHFITDEFVFADYVEEFVQQNEILPRTRSLNTTFILSDKSATFGGLGSSALSLTPNSRMLETLYSGGIVASKSWSLSNESLCLGCVDSNAYTGDFQNFKLADRERDGGLPCLLQVRIESLDYHIDATSAGIALLDNAYTACIDPGVPSLVLTTDAHARLPEVAGAGIEVGVGDTSFLRFKIESGLDVDVAITKTEGDDAKGVDAQALFDGTGVWGAYGEGVPVLGKPFTNAIVLRWDHTTQEYGLASKTLKTNKKSDFKPLGCDNFPSVSSSKEITPSIGVLVGSIVGGFVAGLLFATAAIYFYWRGQKGVKSKYEAMHNEDAVSLRTVDTGGRTFESGLSDAPREPASSLRESLWSHFSRRSASPVMEPCLIGGSQLFEVANSTPAETKQR